MVSERRMMRRTWDGDMERRWKTFDYLTSNLSDVNARRKVQKVPMGPIQRGRHGSFEGRWHQRNQITRTEPKPKE